MKNSRRRPLVAAAPWVVVTSLFAATPAIAAEDAVPATPSVASEAAGTQEVTVVGEPLREDRRFGPNGQPEWTARRRFTNADLYVQAPWQVEASAGWFVQVPREDDDETRHRFRQEFELGLPYHLQADLELSEDVTGGDGEFQSIAVEARWALADWGKIPFNPTFYGEWEFRDGEADTFELKFLLGDSVTQRLYTAVNFFFEQQVGDEREQEFAVSNAWSYALLDSRFGIGLELRLAAEREVEGEEGDGRERETEVIFQVGPSAQWRITDDLSLVVAPLFGATEEAPVLESFVFLRYYFGPGAEDHDEDQEQNEESPSIMSR